MCWANPDCGSPEPRETGCDMAGLSYIVHTGLLNTPTQMTMLQHHNAAENP